jgi:hypothetical protein
MKLKWIVLLGGSTVLAVLSASLFYARAGNAGSSTPFIALSGVSVPEMPAKAADLVQAAAPPDREQTARDVLRAVSLIARPGVLPYVVSAICGGHPELAGAVVTSAIALQPEHVLILAKAALCAAPGQVEQIVFSACQAAPSSCANVLLVASRQRPSAKSSILAGFLRARPDLKLDWEEAEIESGTNDFETIIRQSVQLLTDDASGAAR